MAPTTNGHTVNGVVANGKSGLSFDSIVDCLEAFRAGEFLVVLDSPSRENEGDLIIAAQDMTPAKMAFMVRHTSGIICTPLAPELCQADKIDLPQMVSDGNNSDPNRTAYTISIDANGPLVTTGISAHDRSLTCTALANPKAKPSDFRRPGHVFPLRARKGGVRERMGHTEAAVELCRLTGKAPVGAISEIVEEGEEVVGQAELSGHFDMLRAEGCVAFGKKYGLKVCTIEDLKDYVEQTEGVLES